MANGRCWKHGGASTGPLKHGKYSSVWANQLAAKMTAAEGDQQLFNQQRRTAFLQSLWEDAVERMLTLSDDAPAHLWTAAQNALAEVNRAIREQDANATKDALSALHQALHNGRGIERAEQKACAMVQQIADVSKVQFQGVKTGAEILSAQELQLFVARAINEFRSVDLDGTPDAQRIRQLFARALVRAAGASNR